jgi:hypothetical protein
MNAALKYGKGCHWEDRMLESGWTPDSRLGGTLDVPPNKLLILQKRKNVTQEILVQVSHNWPVAETTMQPYDLSPKCLPIWIYGKWVRNEGGSFCVVLEQKVQRVLELPIGLAIATQQNLCIHFRDFPSQCDGLIMFLITGSNSQWWNMCVQLWMGKWLERQSLGKVWLFRKGCLHVGAGRRLAKAGARVPWCIRAHRPLSEEGASTPPSQGFTLVFLAPTIWKQRFEML